MPKVKRKRRVRRQTGGMLGTVLKEAAKIGYQLGKSKDYKRMGRSGVKGTYKPARGGMTKKEMAKFNRWRYERDKRDHKALCCIM